MHIGKKIKHLASSKNLTASALGKSIGVTKQAVYDLYEREDVNTATLRKVSFALKVPVTVFFEDDELMATQVLVGDNNQQMGGGGTQTMGADAKESESLRQQLALKDEIIAAQRDTISAQRAALSALTPK